MFASISCEIVVKNFARCVISEAHVPGNDEISVYSVVFGRRNSLQEGFFDKLTGPAALRPGLCFHGIVLRAGGDQASSTGGRPATTAAQRGQRVGCSFTVPTAVSCFQHRWHFSPSAGATATRTPLSGVSAAWS